MTTISYPAVGTNGMPETKWSEMMGAPDGVIDDPTGTALAVTRLTNVARIAPGKVRVAGYVLEVTANEDLTIGATGSGTASWIIAAQYDPSLNVAGGGGAAATAGPCRLIATNSTLVTAGGQEYVVLYTFTRTSLQAMTDVTIVDHRVRPTWKYLATSLTASLLSNVPLGTEVELVGGGRYRKLLDTSNNPVWTKQDVFTETTTNSMSGASGFTATGPMLCRYLVDNTGLDVQYDVQLRLTTSSFQFGSDGTIGDKVIANVNGPKPDAGYKVQVDFVGLGGNTSTAANAIPVWGYLNDQGALFISSSLPNAWLTQQSATSKISLQATIRFTKKGS